MKKLIANGGGLTLEESKALIQNVFTKHGLPVKPAAAQSKLESSILFNGRYLGQSFSFVIGLGDCGQAARNIYFELFSQPVELVPVLEDMFLDNDAVSPKKTVADLERMSRLINKQRALVTNKIDAYAEFVAKLTAAVRELGDLVDAFKASGEKTLNMYA